MATILAAPVRPAARQAASNEPTSPRAVLPLPLPLTRFIGRGSAVEEVERLLDGTRLLTVTGAGGSGKTRLALEVARRAAERDAHGVAWVELAPLAGAELVPQQVAAALGLREEGGRAAFDGLLRHLAERAMLLVFDNCEHVVEACAHVAEALLRVAPGLRILATSREPLGVPGERAWLIPALSLPAAADGDAADSEAVQLFIERARDAQPTFTLNHANLRAVVQICRRLEGMPLAIELAAARVRVLPPEELALRLDDAFHALGSGGRGALPRHRTLRAVMDWSYALLSEPERTLLHRLSVFDGGFSLDAVEAVCAGGAGERALECGDVLDLLAALVDRSLVAMQESDGRARYRLLETVRQYAAQRLRDSGEEDTLRRLHADWFIALVADAEPHLTTVLRRAYVERLERNVDNIRQALAWTREHEPAEHLRLAGMLCWFWFSVREWVEGRRWLEGALALPEAVAPTRDRAAALFAAGALASLQAQPAAALPWLEESAELARTLGDDRLEAYANNYIGMALIQGGRPEGKAPVEKALAWFREANDLYGLRLSYLLLSTLAIAARNIEQAHELTTNAVRIARIFGANRELGIALQMHAVVVLQQGDLPLAARTGLESLAAMRDDPMHLFVSRGLDLVGAVLIAQDDAPVGVRLCAAAESIRTSIGAQPFQFDRDRTDRSLAAARRALGDARFDSAWREGSALDMDCAIEAALAITPPDIAPADGPGAPTAGAAAPGTIDQATIASGGPPAGQAASASAAPAVRPATGTAADARIEVRSLGRLEIVRADDATQAPMIAHARPRELLIHMLCHPDGRTREQIGVVFWPEASAAQVKNSFHVALHHLRRSMGRADFIVFEQERYRVNPEVELRFDAAEFEREVRAQLRRVRAGETPVDALRAALSLYDGHFLAGTGAGDWHLEFHDVLQRLCIDGHAALGALLVAREEWKEAAGVFERLLRFDDLNEEACRQLMRCLVHGGERARALRHYERLTAVLREELDAEPEEETAVLAEMIRRGG